ncbi:MAG: tetratricopeptide repeat protein [bacterium]|nr:tetratricopeptide repeat protein [bacterium]
MLKRSLFLSIILAAFFSIPARGAEAAQWIRIETANFEFVGDAPEASIRTAAERLERFREALARILHLEPRTAKTRVIIFKDSESFRPFKTSEPDASVDEKVRGIFILGDDFNCIALSADDLALGTIFHEYVHDVVGANFGSARVPPWLNEGLASYFQTFRMVDEKTATFGSLRPEYVALLRSNPIIPWEEFFALDNFTLHRDSVKIRPVFYAQAWALASYLMNRDHVVRDRRAGGISPVSLIAELNKFDRATLGEAFDFTQPAVHRIEFGGSEPEYRREAVTVSETSADAIQGDLLYRQRNPAAERFLIRAISLDPKHSAAHATLGMLRIRERRFAEAKGFLDDAIAHDSRNHLAYFYSALLLLRENLDESAMLQPLKSETAAKLREALSRSISLNSSFGESHYMLAVVEFSSGDIDVAESAIRRASKLKPGSQNYALLLARILLRQERIDEARAVVEPLASGSGEARAILKDADELARAKRSATGLPPLQVAGHRKPIILQYRDLTAKRVADIDRERENQNYNVMIQRPAADELQVVGYVDRIECVDERIEFRIRTDSARLVLSTRQFDDIRFRIAVPGTRSFALRCGTQLPNDRAAIVYKPTASSSASAGEIRAITFVPEDFEYLTIEELHNAPFFVVEGRPAGDISQNEEVAAKERQAMAAEMRETELSDLKERLRQTQIGENRVMGVPVNVECSAGRIKVSFKIDGSNRVFSSTIASMFELRSFNSNAPLPEVGCLAPLPDLPAVISYRRVDNELISVEFVPEFFRLR